jgi:AraC family transcriptional regulator of adaptative response/methylated-DNA-[protein]-cysteine methyltransferase
MVTLTKQPGTDTPILHQSQSPDCIVTRQLSSVVGPLLAAATTRGVCLLSFADGAATTAESENLKRMFLRPVVRGTNEHLDRLAAQLEEYFAGQRHAFDLPLDYAGTPFQRDVWNGLLGIPFGQTISYAELARRIGRPDAQRAVGQANHHNRITIVIPCHRVVNADGALGGYGGGLHRKQYLLEHEVKVLAGR